MKDNPKRMKFDMYYHLHRDRGHGTEECNYLKNKIEKLIQRGYLKEFVVKAKSKSHEPAVEARRTAPHIERGGRLGEEHSKKDNLPTTGIIGVISGRPAGGGSMRARNAAIREADNVANHVTFSEGVAMQHEVLRAR
ncbi:UNVERIFIED_CONTAM: hypothetical protein Slati_3118000 [Sesamum latifolium]|uniref:Reverse transcriptase domain-containing protein n=1 Tax=Sesamum latifolium TaxID=2727402 RepID=A0AAW2UUZ6_9LAMI